MRDIRQFIVNDHEYLINAMTQIEKNAYGVVFVVDNESHLVGAVSDGDVRRWIVKSHTVDVSVNEMMHKSPRYVLENQETRARQLLEEYRLKAIPVLNKDKQIVDVVTPQFNKKTISEEKLNDVPIVVMAGGKGTRLFPYTKVLPKPLIPVGDVPIIEHIIEQFGKYGAKKYYLIVNHMKNLIKAYFAESVADYEVEFVEEEKPLGTGGGLSLLKGIIKETCVLTNCDILIRDNLLEAYRFHKENQNAITMICSLQKIQIPYGVIEIGSDNNILEMKEKPEMSFFTNTGCYFIEPYVLEVLEDNCSIDFPDIIQKCKDLGYKVGAFPTSSEAWLDMGNPDELDRMRAMLT